MIGAIVSEYSGGVTYRLAGEVYPLPPWICAVCEALAGLAWAAGMWRGKR